MGDINRMITMAKTGAIHSNAQLGLPDKGRVIEGMVVYKSCDLETLDMLTGLYQS